MKNKLILSLAVLLLSVMAFAQGITIKGRVTDESKQPIVGASVILQGTTTGTITDMDGNYSLSIPHSGAVLEVAYITYKTQVVKVENKKVVNVVLQEDLKQLDEVVVVGFGSVRKGDLTSSISSVKGSVLKEQSTGNVNEALQGKVSGVQIIQGGAPGDAPKVLIRGISSINLSTDPLYVVDGIPMGTSINFLNANEIESMEVLKDASASAIYGSRASNGVIMITTKRGKAGKITFNMDLNYGLQIMKNPFNMAGAEEYAQVMNDAADAANLPRPWNDPSTYAGKTTDWWGAGINKLSPQTNLSFGFQGGSDKNTFALNMNYYNQESFYDKGGWKKFTMRFTNDYKFSKRVSAGYSLNPRYESWGNPANWADFDRIDPITPIYKPADQLTGNENEYSIYARSPSYVWNPVASVARWNQSNVSYALASTVRG